VVRAAVITVVAAAMASNDRVVAAPARMMSLFGVPVRMSLPDVRKMVVM
jgi:hypothetical protein